MLERSISPVVAYPFPTCRMRGDNYFFENSALSIVTLFSIFENVIVKF